MLQLSWDRNETSGYADLLSSNVLRSRPLLQI